MTQPMENERGDGDDGQRSAGDGRGSVDRGDMMVPYDDPASGQFSEEVVYQTLTQVGRVFQIAIDRSDIDWTVSLGPGNQSPSGNLSKLISNARQMGVYLKEITVDGVGELFDVVGQGYPVLVTRPDGTTTLLEKTAGSRIESSTISPTGRTASVKAMAMRENDLRNLLFDQVPGGGKGRHIFLAKKELQCDSFSAASSGGAHSGSGHGGGHGGGGHGGDDHGEHHAHMEPFPRFIGLLRLDTRDIWTVILFAFVAGTLSLATPLAIESMVNIVSWGTYVQPLLVIALMLLACLGIAGVLKILQTVLVEVIQRRQLVRLVGDLSHRFPRANQGSLEGEYPRELANRVFDIMTIQKATAVLLFDGVSIVLTTILGLILLGFYHPFLLGFDIVLVISMISMTWVLGRGGIRTAIEESIVKYRIAHWLQDVLASPGSFKTGGGEQLAVERGNRLVTEYIDARRRQFRVIIRQVTFAISLQVIASTAVLGLGGWLVIQNQLTLGQLVASELVVTVVVGAFAKAGKSIEKFYDLMAGMDKVGHLLDIPVDPRFDLETIPDGPAEVRWGELSFPTPTGGSHAPAAEVRAGTKAAIVGDDRTGKSALALTLAGLQGNYHGVAEIAGLESRQAAWAGRGHLVAYAGRNDVFRSTLQDNIDLGRSGIGQNRVRESLQQVGIWTDVMKLDSGVQTMLQTGGYPLDPTQALKLVLARAISGSPRLLVVDGLLDHLNAEDRDHIWKTLAAADAPWTLILVTENDDLVARCETAIAIRTGDSH